MGNCDQRHPKNANFYDENDTCAIWSRGIYRDFVHRKLFRRLEAIFSTPLTQFRFLGLRLEVILGAERILTVCFVGKSQLGPKGSVHFV